MEEQLSPYNQALLHHYKNPYHKSGLQNQQFQGSAENSLCGDSISIHFDLNDHNEISNVSFDAKACMIVVATASMIGKWLDGRKVSDIQVLEREFALLLDREDHFSEEEWGVLKEISKYPTRRKCMELPIKAWKSANP